jgi:hypothetical protein
MISRSAVSIGHSSSEIKELPNAVKGGNCYDSPFPALSIERWGNAFNPKTLQRE